MKSSGPLPEFKSPPVVEVAVSIQFKAPVLTGPSQILWWSQVREKFPKLEQVPPLPRTVETFEPHRSSTPQITLQVSKTPPTPRILMVEQSEAELIQVQQDRFGYNWRKLKPEHTYPRYLSIRNEFVKQLTAFEQFLASEHLEKIVPTQCEVMYVNQIFKEGVWQQHGELHKVIPSVTPHLSENFLPAPESMQFLFNYLIVNEEQKPLGRLYVSVEPSFRASDMEPIFLMSLVARGAPRSEGLEELLRTLDMEHEYIVRGFTALTSPEMHKAWRRIL